MISDKLKSLLSLSKQTWASYSRFVGVTPQATNKKVVNETWTAYDLLKIAELTKTNVVFMDEHNEIVVKLNINDLKKITDSPTKQQQ